MLQADLFKIAATSSPYLHLQVLALAIAVIISTLHDVISRVKTQKISDEVPQNTEIRTTRFGNPTISRKITK